MTDRPAGPPGPRPGDDARPPSAPSRYREAAPQRASEDVGDETPPHGRRRFGARRRPSRAMRDRADEMADLLDRAAPSVRARSRRRSLGVPAAVLALGALAAGGVGVALGIDAHPTGTDVGTGTGARDDGGAGDAIPDPPIAAPPVEVTSTPTTSGDDDTPTSTRRADLVNEQSRVAAAERPRAAPPPRVRPPAAPTPTRPTSSRPGPRPTSTRTTTTTPSSTTTTTPTPQEDDGSTSSSSSSRSSPARSAPEADGSRGAPDPGETGLTPSSPTVDQG